MQEIRCSICGELKPLESFNPVKRGGDKRRGYCRICANESNARWRLANKERKAKTRREWDKTHPKRAHERQKRWRRNHPEKYLAQKRRRRIRVACAVSNLTDIQRQNILRIGCFLCGSKEKLEVAHDIAVANGGNATHSNLFCLCSICNSKMQSKSLSQIVAQLNF